jgi:hypothetical protein
MAARTPRDIWTLLSELDDGGAGEGGGAGKGETTPTGEEGGETRPLVAPSETDGESNTCSVSSFCQLSALCQLASTPKGQHKRRQLRALCHRKGHGARFASLRPYS